MDQDVSQEPVLEENESFETLLGCGGPRREMGGEVCGMSDGEPPN